MDFHVIFTIGEYTFKRLFSGWFLRILGMGAVLVFWILFQEGVDAEQALLENRALVADLIGLTAFVLVASMGASELPRDIDTRTILIILAKPVEKCEVVIGKFLGLFYVVAATTVILFTCVLIGCWVQDLPPDVNLLQKTVFCLLQGMVISALVTLLSTQLSEIPILALTAFYLVLGYHIFYLPKVAMLDTIPMAARIPLNAFYYAFCNFRFLAIAPEDTLLGTVPWSHFVLAIGYGICYSAGLLFLSVWSFNNRDVAG